MPDDNETEQVEVQPQQETPQEPEGEQPADPWADPAAARREIEKLRRESAKYRTKASELEPLAAKARELEDAQKTEAQRLQEQLTAARDQREAAIRAAVAGRVEALAARDFADPEDAAGALDLAAYAGEDGSIDSDRIRADLATLLERKPHWARPQEGPRSPRPDPTQGSSGNGNRTPSRPEDEFSAWLKQSLRGR